MKHLFLATVHVVMAFCPIYAILHAKYLESKTEDERTLKELRHGLRVLKSLASIFQILRF